MKQNLFDFIDNDNAAECFLCWLLSCANCEERDSDPKLYCFSCSILDYILSDKKPSKYFSIEIHKKILAQTIIVVVNQNMVFFLTNRRLSMQNRHDLSVLRDNVSLGKIPGLPVAIARDQILLFFYEIFPNPSDNHLLLFKDELLYLNENPPAVELIKVCSMLTRTKLLDIFQRIECNTQNQIVTNFMDYLNCLEAQKYDYEYLPVSKWNSTNIKFFFQLVEREILQEATWGCIIRHRHSVWCLWWASIRKQLEATEISLIIQSICAQIEIIPDLNSWEVVIKCVFSSSQKYDIHTLWTLYRYFKEKFNEYGIFTYKKRFVPDRHCPVIGLSLNLDNYEEYINIVSVILEQSALDFPNMVAAI